MERERLKNAYDIYCSRQDWGHAVSVAVEMFKADPEDYAVLQDVRSKLRKSREGESSKMDLLHRTYIVAGKDKFDDFMIALEWNRPTKEKFWLPRRKKLMNVCQALQDLEDGKLDEVFLEMPPRVGKSTIVQFFVIWVSLRHSELTNLYASYSDTVVGTFYNGILEILDDPDNYDWKTIFPEQSVAGTNAKDRTINIDRDKKYATITCRSLYGTLNGSCDSNGYEIADDLISGIEEALNKDRLFAAWLKVQNNFLPRGKESCKHIWIGTRWSITDPAGMRIEMLENDEKFASVRWAEIKVPALDANDESNFEYACGVGFSTETYVQRRAAFERSNDIESWQAQYQQEPVDRDGTVFKASDLRYFNGVLPTGTLPDRVFMAVDPAWGGGDYVAAPVCVQFGEDIYVPDVVFDKGEKNVTQRQIAKKAQRHGVRTISVEATKTTRDYADGVDKLLKKNGYKATVMHSVKNFTGTGKQQRIFDKAPDIREHMIFLESGKRTKEYEKFMSNVYAFSMTAKKQHDDAPDSLAMAVNVAFFGKRQATIMQRTRLGF